MFRKEYALSRMTFKDLRNMIDKYMRTPYRKITTVHIGDDTFLVTTTTSGDASKISTVTAFKPIYQISFYKDNKVVFNVGIGTDLVSLGYINAAGETSCNVCAVTDTCTCDLECFGFMNCKFNNIKFLEQYLHELVSDKVDRHNTTVKCFMIFTAMMSILGYCIVKVVKYVKADKVDRKNMLKSTLIPMGVLAAFSVTTNTFRCLIMIITKSYELIRDSFKKISNIFKKG